MKHVSPYRLAVQKRVYNETYISLMRLQSWVSHSTFLDLAVGPCYLVPYPSSMDETRSTEFPISYFSFFNSLSHLQKVPVCYFLLLFTSATFTSLMGLNTTSCIPRFSISHRCRRCGLSERRRWVNDGYL